MAVQSGPKGAKESISNVGKSENIYFWPETTTNSKRCCLWDVRKTRGELGDDVCITILFVHAILECDTTSGVFSIGNAVYLKKVKKSVHLFQQAKGFCGDIKFHRKTSSKLEKMLL